MRTVDVVDGNLSVATMITSKGNARKRVVHVEEVVVVEVKRTLD